MFVQPPAVSTWKTVWFVSIRLILIACTCHDSCDISVIDPLHLDWGMVVLEDKLVKIVIGICVISEYRLIFSKPVVIDIVTPVVSYELAHAFILGISLVTIPTRVVLFCTSSLGCMKFQGEFALKLFAIFLTLKLVELTVLGM